VKKPVYIIVAVDSKNGIGKRGELPWRIKGEIRYFKERTLKVKDPKNQNAVIMGRNTWESLPEKFRPLPNRKNFVLTSNPTFAAAGAKACVSLEQAISLANTDPQVEKIFIIGGGKVFEQAISIVDGIYFTAVKGDFNCDIFFPEIPEYFEEVKSLGHGKEGNIEYDFLLYLNKEND